MNRIILGKTLNAEEFTRFDDFGVDCPYVLIIKKFHEDYMSIPHYVDYLEILACENLEGEVIINNRHFLMKGRQVFFISPGFVHFVSVKKSGGTMYVLKISPKHLAYYLHLDHIMFCAGIDLGALPYEHPRYDEIKLLLDRLISSDGHFLSCLVHILHILLALQSSQEKSLKPASSEDDYNSHLLRMLLDWTTENFSRNIRLEQAARQVGYSKYYFSRWFRQSTGLTYHRYVNLVRISAACRFLMQNKPIHDVSSLCGFANVSHFIRLFGQIKNCTPGKYLSEKPDVNPLPSRDLS